MIKPVNKKFANLDEADEGRFQNKKEIPLDVRPVIDSGVDPFEEIVKSLCRLQENEYLKIINYFEPIPLYARLKQMGYGHRTKKHGIYYYIYVIKNQVEKKEETLLASKPDNIPLYDSYGFLKIPESKLEALAEKLKKENPELVASIDVSELPAPEPVEKILEILKIDQAPVLLVVRHRKLPLHLPGFIKEKKYLVSAFEKNEHVQVYIFKESIL